MTTTKERLANCFRLVFPKLKVPVEAATPQTVEEWDSVAAITLVNVIEEEFDIQIDYEVLAEFDSFPKVLEYVEGQAF